MADYYPLLKRAVASLPDNTPEARDAMFVRAKTALTNQLRSVEPPLSEADIARERLALDDVIRRIESEERQAAEGAPAGEAGDAPEPEAPYDDGYDAAGSVEDEPPRGKVPPQAGQRRPRVEAARRRGDGGGRRGFVVVVALSLVIAAIAGLAYYVNKVNQSELPAPVAQGPNESPPVAERKFDERISGDATPTAPVPPPAATPPAATPPATPSPPRTAQAPQPAIDVAQRAILYEESPDNPQTPRVLAGRAVWRLDTLNPGQGQPLETVVRANLEVPDAGVGLGLVFRRNLDATLPASHTIEMTFSKLAGSDGRAIRDIGVPQFKTDEGARGTPLSGLPVPVTDTFFLVGLSNVGTDIDRNLDLIRSRSWIDIPIRYANGSRAVLAFEKGVSGSQALNEALRVWQ